MSGTESFVYFAQHLRIEQLEKWSLCKHLHPEVDGTVMAFDNTLFEERFSAFTHLVVPCSNDLFIGPVRYPLGPCFCRADLTDRPVCFADHCSVWVNWQTYWLSCPTWPGLSCW